MTTQNKAPTHRLDVLLEHEGGAVKNSSFLRLMNSEDVEKTCKAMLSGGDITVYAVDHVFFIPRHTRVVAWNLTNLYEERDLSVSLSLNHMTLQHLVGSAAEVFHNGLGPTNKNGRGATQVGDDEKIVTHPLFTREPQGEA